MLPVNAVKTVRYDIIVTHCATAQRNIMLCNSAQFETTVAASASPSVAAELPLLIAISPSPPPPRTAWSAPSPTTQTSSCRTAYRRAKACSSLHPRMPSEPSSCIFARYRIPHPFNPLLPSISTVLLLLRPALLSFGNLSLTCPILPCPVLLFIGMLYSAFVIFCATMGHLYVSPVFASHHTFISWLDIPRLVL